MSLPIAVLASGRGSNLQAILDAIKAQTLAAQVVVVLSDKADAKALDRAKEEGISAFHINPKAFENKVAYEAELIKYIEEYHCQLICLAGYMRILSPYFVQHAPCMIMNIHPSLLPSFPGLHAHQQALDYGVRYSGCTVHFVNEDVDGGAIIFQEIVEILPDDTEDTLSERILIKEHQIYPKAIQMFAQNRLEISGRHVVVKGVNQNEESLN